MWPDSPNGFTYNLLSEQSSAVGKIRMVLAYSRRLETHPPCQFLVPTASAPSRQQLHTRRHNRNKLRLDLCVQLVAALSRAGLVTGTGISTRQLIDFSMDQKAKRTQMPLRHEAIMRADRAGLATSNGGGQNQDCPSPSEIWRETCLEQPD